MELFESRFLAPPSWRIDYVHNRTYSESPAGTYPGKHIINARRGEIALAFEQELSGDRRKVQVWHLWRDGVSVCYDTSGSYTIFPTKEVGLYQYFFYTDTLQLDTYVGDVISDPSIAKIMGGSSWSKVFRKAIALPESVQLAAAMYIARPTLEAVDGAECHVLELRDKDVIWLDVDHGFICRRRTQFLNGGAPLTSTDNMDLFEASPGIWLPRTQRVTRYFDDAPRRGRVWTTETNSFAKSNLETFRWPISRFRRRRMRWWWTQCGTFGTRCKQALRVPKRRQARRSPKRVAGDPREPGARR